jgi:hypothetical protein
MSPASATDAFATVLDPGFVFDAQPVSMDNGGVLRRAMARFGPRIFRWGAPTQPVGGSCALASASVVVTDPEVQLGPDIDESYTITVHCSDGVDPPVATLHAATVFGAIWALETFTQMPQLSDTGNATTYWLPCTNITDKPRFPTRAVMVDCARHFVSIAALMQLVDVMSANKQNMLHLHINDAPSWPLEIKAYPLLTQKGAMFLPGLSSRRTTWMQSDVKLLVLYATDRGVRLIPELDFPTHSDGPLSLSYPQFLTEWTDANNRTFRNNFDATNESAWEFYETVWKEVTNLFPDPEVHIGGDEVFLPAWNRSSSVANWIKKHATACPDDPSLCCDSVASLVKYFARRAVATVGRLGKRAIAWYGYQSAIVDAYGGPSDYGRAPTPLTLDDWDGWNPQGPVFWQPGLARLSYDNENTTVILSGPYYKVQAEQATNNVHESWQQMAKVDPRDWRDAGISTSHAAVNDWAQPNAAIVTTQPCTDGLMNAWSVPPTNTTGPVKIKISSGAELCLDSSQGTAGTLLASECDSTIGAQRWQFRELVPGTGIGHLFNAGGFGCNPWACPAWCPGVQFVPPPLFTCCAMFEWMGGTVPPLPGGETRISQCYDAQYPAQRIRLEPVSFFTALSAPLHRIRNVPLANVLGGGTELCLALGFDPTAHRHTAAEETAAKERVRGSKLCLWGDTGHVDSSSLLSVATTNLVATAESSWSPNGTASQLPAREPAMGAQRCRLMARGYPSLQSGIAAADVPCPATHVPPATDLEAQVLALERENRALRDAALLGAA